MNNRFLTDTQIAKIATILFQTKKDYIMPYASAHLMGLIVDAFQHEAKLDESNNKQYIVVAVDAWSDAMEISRTATYGLIARLHNRGYIERKKSRLYMVDETDIYKRIVAVLSDSADCFESSATDPQPMHIHTSGNVEHGDCTVTVKVTFAKS